MSITESDVDLTGAWLRDKLEHMLDIIDKEEKHPTLPYGLKRCSSCRRVLSVESFYRFHRSRDGRLGRCKSCFLTKRGESERERGRSPFGKIGTPVTSEAELREALQTGEVFFHEPA